MKTLDEIKNEVAKEFGVSWIDLIGGDYINEVCKRYARECCDSENERLKNELENERRKGRQEWERFQLDKVTEMENELKEANSLLKTVQHLLHSVDYSEYVKEIEDFLKDKS